MKNFLQNIEEMHTILEEILYGKMLLKNMKILFGRQYLKAEKQLK